MLSSSTPAPSAISAEPKKFEASLFQNLLERFDKNNAEAGQLASSIIFLCGQICQMPEQPVPVNETSGLSDVSAAEKTPPSIATGLQFQLSEQYNLIMKLHLIKSHLQATVAVSYK